MIGRETPRSRAGHDALWSSSSRTAAGNGTRASTIRMSEDRPGGGYTGRRYETAHEPDRTPATRHDLRGRRTSVQLAPDDQRHAGS